MSHNNLNGNERYSLRLGDFNDEDVSAENNWWGAEATVQMDIGENPKNISQIFDIFDDGSKGSVDYSERLSGVQPLTAEPVSRIIEPVNEFQAKGGVINIRGIASAPVE